MENYKVCILAAGIGSRMSSFTKTLNKALIPVQGKPVICHIIEKFSEDIEIVIATGYKKETIIDFLESAYPTRKITFVAVDNYDGKGSGPGYSLLCCKSHLQCPFIIFAADTLVKEDVPSPTINWFGIADVADTERFCSAKVENGEIVRIDDKVKVEGNLAFIGLAGVNDFEHFWNSLENNEQLIAKEVQVSNGFISLIEKRMLAQEFTWFDTGTPSAYKHTLNNYPFGKSYKGN
jgi:choline kinase